MVPSLQLPLITPAHIRRFNIKLSHQVPTARKTPLSTLHFYTYKQHIPTCPALRYPFLSSNTPSFVTAVNISWSTLITTDLPTLSRQEPTQSLINTTWNGTVWPRTVDWEDRGVGAIYLYSRKWGFLRIRLPWCPRYPWIDRRLWVDYGWGQRQITETHNTRRHGYGERHRCRVPMIKGRRKEISKEKRALNARQFHLVFSPLHLVRLHQRVDDRVLPLRQVNFQHLPSQQKPSNPPP